MFRPDGPINCGTIGLADRRLVFEPNEHCPEYYRDGMKSILDALSGKKLPYRRLDHETRTWISGEAGPEGNLVNYQAAVEQALGDRRCNGKEIVATHDI